jgi:hypothetical protein
VSTGASRGLGALLGLALALAPAPAARATDLASARALARALTSSGRAEAVLRYLVASPSGDSRTVRATLALELPAMARIDVAGTGEALVARPDGGEWLQPSTRQLLRFRPRHGAAALRWWNVLLGGERAARERPLGGNRWVLVLRSEPGAAEDSAEVWLDPRGLPARLVVPAGNPEAAVYRLGGWRFMRRRGDPAFRLATPRGYEAVDLP